jgi:hypothetical protein
VHRILDADITSQIPVKDDDIILSAPRIGDAVCLTCKASMRKEDASRTGQALSELETHHWLGGQLGMLHSLIAMKINASTDVNCCVFILGCGSVVAFFETPEHGGLSGFADRCGLLSVRNNHSVSYR